MNFQPVPSTVTTGPGSCIRKLVLCGICLALVSCSGSHSGSSTTTAENPIGPNLIQISSDPYVVAPGQHATEVEPHMIAFGNTLVAAFQAGRIFAGGGTAIGFATSSDGGTTWTHGFLPGLTKGEGTGPYDSASDPVVAYDPKHAVWLIASLPISNSFRTPAVVVSRSTDGGLTWQSPVGVVPDSALSDKNWIACDTWTASPFYGNCYMQWDDPANLGQIEMSTSTDGGLTWSPAVSTAGMALGIGGQPLAQPNGTVVVPVWLLSGQGNQLAAFTSTDGGSSWGLPVVIATVQSHRDAGGIRSGPLPSAALDGAGTVWVVWEDCRFRSGCSTNDLVYSTSTNGVNWSAVTRIPIDDVSTTIDHFIPGVGIDPATSGATAHVAIHYYDYSRSNCNASTCQLIVGYISSSNGGSSWNTPVTVAGPMQLAWLPTSQNGLMVGDYIATVFTNGVPHGVFAVAAANSGNKFNEAIYTGTGLTMTAAGRQLSSVQDHPLHRLSDRFERETPEKGVTPPPPRRNRRSAK